MIDANKRELRVFSLFAGCGGMDLGFIMAKHPKLKYRIIWANDFDKDACATYKENIGNEIVPGDIWDIDLKKTPDADVVIGGFPCEDFSIVRGDTRQGFEVKRGLLYTKFVEAVSLKLPLFFVAENVKGLLSMQNGQAIQKIIRDFAKVNNVSYNVQYKLINFADYGVPQKRERVIIVGVRNDLNLNFTYPEPTHIGRYISVKKAFEGVENVPYNNELLKITQSTKAKLEKIPAGGELQKSGAVQRQELDELNLQEIAS